MVEARASRIWAHFRLACRYDGGQAVWLEPEEAAGMNPMDLPFLVLVMSFVLLYSAAYIGDLFRNKVLPLKEEGREDFGVVLGATLTLLALLLGFSFSMAVSRYDQRKNYEEAEANAIGTEYLRADLLPANIAAMVRVGLVGYLHRRIAFYSGKERAHPDVRAEAASVR